MKQGRSVITLVMVLLAAALSVYFGVHVFNTFNDPFTTTLAYSYTIYDSVQADGLLVREERVFPAQAGIVDVIRGEGEKVGVSQTVAMVYRDSQAQDLQGQMDQLALEIQLLEHAAVDSGSVESAARLDEDILQAVVALRSDAALGDYNDLEEQVLELKSSVLKRGYTYGDGISAADLSQRIKDLKGQHAALRQQTVSAITRVRAGESGIFSNLVDGFEERLTPETVFQLTPAALEGMLEEGKAADSGAPGKLITSDCWQFAAILPEETAGRLRKGDTATVRFTGDFTQDVDMRVEQVGKSEDGRAVVVFSTDRYLGRTTLLRRQTVQLIFDSWSGLRVPKEAVHMVKTAHENQETGETTETSRLGVYALVGGRAEFKAVEVVTEGADHYILRGLATGSRALRAGDEIILNALGLYDGQLLEY